MQKLSCQKIYDLIMSMERSNDSKAYRDVLVRAGIEGCREFGFNCFFYVEVNAPGVIDPKCVV